MVNRKGQNYPGDRNPYVQQKLAKRQGDYNRKQNAAPSGSGYRKPKGIGGNKGGGNKGVRGCKSFRGTAGIYNHEEDWTRNRQYAENKDYQENAYQRGENSFDDYDNGTGFQKFRDSNASNTYVRRGNNFSIRNTGNYTWYRDSCGDIAMRQEASHITQFETLEVPENKTVPSELVEPSPICLNEPIESKEAKLIHKIKAEKVEPDCATPKQRKTKVQTSSSESSSDSDNGSKAEKPPSTPVQDKTKEKSKPIQNINIKNEPVTLPVEKRKAHKEAVVAPPSSSSSDTSVSDSSEEEENVPTMPKPIKATESVKPKTEKVQEDDVVCLGLQSNIENLIDNDESNEPKPCMVCNKQGHSPHECQMKCKKCNQSDYEIQTVCKNCGVTYNQSLQSMPKPPNPFAMFMQFMQFCMSQYSDVSTDIKYPFPQFENPSAPVLGPTPTVEVTRKDIANSKSNHKRTKSGSKHSRKKARMSISSDKDSDSDSSSKATTSTKKQKKLSKSAGRDVEPSQTTQQPQPQLQLPQFSGHFPAHLPFAGAAFGANGYNPMLAFSQMMGFNPTAMNFTR